MFRHKEGQEQPQIVTFRGVDLSEARRIVKLDQQTSISFRPVTNGDTYITVEVTSEDRPGRFLYGASSLMPCVGLTRLQAATQMIPFSFIK